MDVADKLKAVRLLGRQPFDVLDDQDVALVYLASHRLEPAHSDWAWEILTEMNDKSKKQFRDDVASRGLERLEAGNRRPPEALLLDLVAPDGAHSTARAETHRERRRAYVPDLPVYWILTKPSRANACAPRDHQRTRLLPRHRHLPETEEGGSRTEE